MFQGFYPCYIHTVPGMYFTFALNHVGGLLLRWYRDAFAFPEVREATLLGRDAYEVILEHVPEKPSHLMVLPHFNGSGNPWCDMDSKGAIVGLTLASTRHDLARAILESQTYELRINLETLQEAGISIREVRAVGGGARSPLWLQIKADVLGRPIRTLRVREAACLGAAILAGAAAGIYPSVAAGAQRAVALGDTYHPREIEAKMYAQKYKVYRELYPALKGVNHLIS
jgi:sugar (pentulose or hexulose) kinase